MQGMDNCKIISEFV